MDVARGLTDPTARGPFAVSAIACFVKAGLWRDAVDGAVEFLNSSALANPSKGQLEVLLAQARRELDPTQAHRSPLRELLAAYRRASATEREKGTYFEELIQAYLRNEPCFRDLYSDVWTYTECDFTNLPETCPADGGCIGSANFDVTLP